MFEGLKRYRRKFVSSFEPTLSDDQLEKRLKVSYDIAEYLITHEEYVGWITSVWVFGSLARAASKGSSDIDLAVLVRRVVELGDEYLALHERMYQVIVEGKHVLGIPTDLLIVPTILQSSWLRDPDWTTDNPGVIYKIQNEGKQLISR